ncbi:MAG: DUF2254 domain-containing protein [Phyllobacteriaceae bacterium]|nr:DUF2254 domain-containing protein [Phyllobacteriaceae bacterium]
MSYLKFKLRQLVQRMWFLPAAFSGIALLTIVIAYLLALYAPEELPFIMPANAVQTILQILASSLLTVAVFALSTVVSAFSGASAATTPRAVPLIAGDLRAQTSISVFIGAFLFSIVGIIGLSIGIYSEAGRLFLFVVTLSVVVLVVTSLIRWIGQISAIGRVGYTIGAVEKATRDAINVMEEFPYLGGQRLDWEPEGEAIPAPISGYVQHCDMPALQRVAEEHDLKISVMARPGAYATPVKPLALVEGRLDDDLRERISECFVLGESRTYDSDPRFGMIVLGEIGDKAMSAGINDPGTGIVVIDTATRLLLDWKEERQEVRYDRVFVSRIRPADVLDDVYRPTARDGAAILEVMIRLMKSLETVAECNPAFTRAAHDFARQTLRRAEAAMKLDDDFEVLKKVADWVEPA